jgi:hypothetical protein
VLVSPVLLLWGRHCKWWIKKRRQFSLRVQRYRPNPVWKYLKESRLG